VGSWGAIIMGFFGAFFAAMTLYWQFDMVGLTLVIPFIGFGIIGLSAARVIRRPGDGIMPSKQAQRVIMWSSIGEGVGLFLAANIVMNLHHPAFLLPAMALIVGLHFVPIARAAPFPAFYALAGALIFFGLIGFVVAAPSGGAISGFASAGGLWIASALAVRRDARFKRKTGFISSASA
jgi:hypothetical protein